MSPSEDDLRAALRDGEGDPVDPDAALAAGRRRLSQRRVRVASVTGAVVAVLAVGTTAGLLATRDDGSHHTATGGPSSISPSSSTTAHPPLIGGPSSADVSSSGGSAATGGGPACPATFPHTALPGGGGTGRFGSTGPLFAEPVSQVVVCAYGSTAQDVAPARLVLTGTTAASLVQGLESAATKRPTVACPDYRVADDHRLAFIGVTSSGSALTPVTTTLGQPTCSVVVTNGTALRYAWSPEANLATVLQVLAPRPSSLVQPSAPPRGANGSPVR